MNIINPPRPNDKNSLPESIIAFYELIKILRKRSSWDKNQTHQSIASLSIEEVYEMIDAIHKNDDNELKKELGDLLLHVFMHAYFAEERKIFNITDVIFSVHEKLISRLPSVFTQNPEQNEELLMKNWEEIKQTEGRNSVLDGIPKTIPALLRAERMQLKASRVGFDWNKKEDVWDKVTEELNELKVAISNNNSAEIEEEFGDLLFSLVNVSRFEKVVLEEALMKANNKFEKRFKFIEQKAKSMDKSVKELTFDEMNQFWNEAKKEK